MEHTTPQDQPQQPKRFQCRHIFIDGHRCGSAALRNEDFCYYHHTTRRPAANPRARRARRAAFNLPLPEDRSAIQASIGQVLQRIAANDLDPRRAGLLLYGLQIAALNLPKQQPLQPENEKPHEAIVEQIEIHPELGPLAPQAEAPHPYRLTRQHILEYKIREADEMREKLFKKERELKDKENEFGIMQGRVIVMEAELRKLKSAAPPTPRPAYPQPAILPEIKAVAADAPVSKPGADGCAGWECIPPPFPFRIPPPFPFRSEAEESAFPRLPDAQACVSSQDWAFAQSTNRF